MRTTVDLDAGLLRRLRIEARRRGVTVKELLAVLLERGLRAPSGQPRQYRVPTFGMGRVAAGINLDKALRVVDALEDEEIARELDARK